MENKYIITITYNFDTDYFVKKCPTRTSALNVLKNLLEKEIETVKSECEYTPSVITFCDDDIILVYAEGYTANDKDRSFLQEDCAFYRIFEI